MRRRCDPHIHVRWCTNVMTPDSMDITAASRFLSDERLKARARKYGLTTGALYLMWESQRRGCAVCRRTAEIDDLVIDHNHATGAVRGLLCARCNTMLGLGGDNPQLLRAGAKYLAETGHGSHRFLDASDPRRTNPDLM